MNAVLSRTRVLVVYAVALAIAAGIAGLLGRNPLAMAAWIDADTAPRVMLSAGLGALVGGLTIAATRLMMRRAAWARALHADLRPVVRRADDATLLTIAVASGVAEEVLFRGLLVPVIGIVGSSLVFGVVHQVRGRARWGWMAWAAATGALFAVVFALTGSLLGPIVGHVLINAVNLRVLRDVEPAAAALGSTPSARAPAGARERRMGGLLKSH